jgi:selT/selW/selH-like putative selenoprotein
VKGIEAELVHGASGVFDVAVDGRRIFSKHEAGRFPEAEEILLALG